MYARQRMRVDDCGRTVGARAEECITATAASNASNTIYQLNIAALPVFGAVPFVGRTGSGKSSALMTLAYHQRHLYDLVIVFCDSADDAMEYGKRFPGAFIYEEWDEKVLEQLYDTQQANTRKGKMTSALVIIEDFAYDNKVMNSKIMKRLHNNGRHARIRTLYTIQDPKAIKPRLRDQVKHVFVLPEKKPAARAKTFEAFNPCFRTLAEFESVMKNCTQGGRCMVLYMGNDTDEQLANNVFWMHVMRPWPMFHIPTKRRLAARTTWGFHKKWMSTTPAEARAQPPIILKGRPLSAVVRGPEARAPCTVQTLGAVRALKRIAPQRLAAPCAVPKPLGAVGALKRMRANALRGVRRRCAGRAA